MSLSHYKQESKYWSSGHVPNETNRLKDICQHLIITLFDTDIASNAHTLRASPTSAQPEDQQGHVIVT